MKIIKNRGACSNPGGRFEKDFREAFEDGWYVEEPLQPLETILMPEKAKSIISRNDSPDIGFDQSINPYRGCEHGCIYCYARPSHSYINLSAGIDFETKIFYKVDAAKLLEQEFNQKNYVCKPIMIGANTDPYQPIEKKLKITRSLLEVCQEYQHPITIITKGMLIERDLDILSEMAKKNLAKVAISVTTLSSKLKHILEPRAAAPQARLRAIKHLAEASVPVRVMVAPIIPAINDSELEKILKEVSDNGAKQASYVLVRLPYEVKDLFKEWLTKYFPDRAEKVMNIIRQTRGGKEYDSTFGKRMQGEGEFAELIAHRFQIAVKRNQLNQTPSARLETSLFRKKKVLKTPHQLDLFDYS